MADIDWQALAADHPAVASLIAAMPQALRGAARHAPFAAGATIFRQGQRPTAMICVLHGELRLIRRHAGGGEMVLQRARGGFIAEASLETTTYHCDAVAAGDGELLRFPVAAFRAALAEGAEFNRGWMSHLAREVRRLRAQCQRLSLRSAAERIIHCIETEGRGGRLVLTTSRKAWAAELGLSHEALYRTLAGLAADGTVAIDGDTLTVRPGHRRSA